MKILENRGICIGLMLVLVVCGFLLGGYKGLAGQYRKAADVFFVGETGDGICIANDMGERANALTNLQTVAKKYPAANDIEAACERFARAAENRGLSLHDPLPQSRRRLRGRGRFLRAGGHSRHH